MPNTTSTNLKIFRITQDTPLREIDEILEKAYRELQEGRTKEQGVLYPVVLGIQNFYNYLQDLIEYDNLTEEKCKQLIDLGLIELWSPNPIHNSLQEMPISNIVHTRNKWATTVTEEELFDEINGYIISRITGQLLVPEDAIKKSEDTKEVPLKFHMKAVIENGDLSYEYMDEMDGAEVQLFKNSISEHGLDKLASIAGQSDKKIISIHTPLDSGRSVNIEDILSDEGFKQIKDTMRLADKISTMQGTDKIHMVIHTELDDVGNSYYDFLIQEIACILDKLMHQYTRVHIAIENTMMLNNYKGTPIFTNSTNNNIIVMKSMQAVSNCPRRFGVVIDNCHANLNDKLLGLVQSVNPSIKNLSRTEDLFRQAGEDTVIIHLSDITGFGYEEFNHGIGHKDSKESRARLKETLNQILKYAPNAEVVIEVTEKDYRNRPDAMQTYRLAKEILKEIAQEMEQDTHDQLLF